MSNSFNQELGPKPYEMVAFPRTKPTLARPAGHDRYQLDRSHGKLYLNLQVQTALHVSTGVVAMGSDVGKKSIPLIKTMTLGTDQKLVIQGSSLKGCVRSVYEAITNSTLAVITGRYRDQIPAERLPCKNRELLCPASRVFGAMDWQGLVQFSDATGRLAQSSVGFMPSLYRPRPERPDYYSQNGRALGRKFYYNMNKAASKGENQGIPVQQAGRSFVFETVLHYQNLAPEELGILLIALGQDVRNPMALKVGGGKPIGMGTMTVEISAIEQSQDVRDRYREYDVAGEKLSGNAMQQFIQTQVTIAHGSKLLEKEQLAAVANMLAYPSDREPPSGMY